MKRLILTHRLVPIESDRTMLALLIDVADVDTPLLPPFAMRVGMVNGNTHAFAVAIRLTAQLRELRQLLEHLGHSVTGGYLDALTVQDEVRALRAAEEAAA